MKRPHLALSLAAILVLPGAAGAQDAPCGPGSDLLLVNGRIHTMDPDGRVVSTAHILGNRFAAVGGEPSPTRCTEVIDLDGRTVVPGLIDNHNHIVLLGLRPGHDVRLENARSIDDAPETLAAKAAEVPAGEWITSIGGFDPNQLVPPPDAPRLPTLDEIDRAVPDHPVYLQISFAGPAVTNSAAKAFF